MDKHHAGDRAPQPNGLQAREFMTTSVLSVEPETPVQRVAELLLEHGVSAVPVVADGLPVGLISESDLVSRSSAQPCSRRCWGVRLLALGGAPQAELLDGFEHTRVARDVMTSPVITTSEAASAREILQLMATNGIKRLPVVRGRRIVGIISRADLLRAIAQGLGDATAASQSVSLGGALVRLDRSFLGNGRTPENGAVPAAPEPPHVVSAEDFRAAVVHHQDRETNAKREERRQTVERHAHEVEILLGTHVSEDAWRHMLLDARHAAESGELEHQILRMPRELCTDGGRMINVGEPGWTSTLRGEAAELWLRWKRDLQPRGFRFVARTLEYPDGLPGDIGLFLAWNRG